MGNGNGAFRAQRGGVLDGTCVLGKRVVANTLATSKLFKHPDRSEDGKAGTVVEVKLRSGNLPPGPAGAASVRATF